MSNIIYQCYNDLTVGVDFRYKENIKDAPKTIPRHTPITSFDLSGFFKLSEENRIARIKYFKYLDEKEKNNTNNPDKEKEENVYTYTSTENIQYNIIIADKRIRGHDITISYPDNDNIYYGFFKGGGYQPTKKYARRTIKGKSKTSKGKSKTSKGKSKTSKGKSKTIKGKSKTRHLIR